MTDAIDLPGREPSIVQVVLHRVAVRLVEARAAAHGTEQVRESILVEVADADGATGWGECVTLARPTYSVEWTAGAWMVLHELLVPALLAGEHPSLVGHPMAGAALDDAILDLRLRLAGRSLTEILSSRDRVASRAVVGIEPDLDLLEGAVSSRLVAGHRSIKLKVVPGQAAGAVERVRDRWPDLDLAIDANGSFDLHRDEVELAALDAVGLAYLEQPLPGDDLVGLAALRRRATTPIALDESVASLGSLVAAHELGAVDLLNLKPARFGGVRAALPVVAEMAAREIGGFVGGMYELGVGRSVALCMAASDRLADVPCDLGPSDAYVAHDITEPFLLDGDGTIAVGSELGISRHPDGSSLDAVTVARAELRR